MIFKPFFVDALPSNIHCYHGNMIGKPLTWFAEPPLLQNIKFMVAAHLKLKGMVGALHLISEQKYQVHSSRLARHFCFGHIRDTIIPLLETQICCLSQGLRALHIDNCRLQYENLFPACATPLLFKLLPFYELTTMDLIYKHGYN